MTDHPPSSEPSVDPLEAMLRRDFAVERQQTSADRAMDQLAVDRVMFLARQPKSDTRRGARPWPRHPELSAGAMRRAVAAAAAAQRGSGTSMSWRPPTGEVRAWSSAERVATRRYSHP